LTLAFFAGWALMEFMKLVTLFFTSLMFIGSLAIANHHESDWVSLFDGKSLKGWTASKENPNSFSVKKGTLVVDGGRSHLFYTGKVKGANFKNFELKLKAKTMKSANGGVYFHTSYQDEGWPTQGFECQVNTSQKDPKKTGSLYAIANVYVAMEPEEPFIIRVDKAGAQVYREKAPSTDGEWFDYHIIVKDDVVTLQINGETTVSWTQPEGYAGPNPGMAGRVLGSGTFALQAHDPNSVTHFKDIQVKVLD
jgi:hypothetical protein|tara:strand:- start:1294 stop:2046 length:753 start_codon:yes stop_codon:yes gene_type:complete